MNKKKKQQPVSTKKKLSLLSTIMLVVGASIGSGIYYKNAEILDNVQSSIVLAMLSWVVALIAIFAMAMTLVEICSANSQANDEGIVGWVKTFCHKYFYQASRNFMSYIYLPINFFCMSVYGVQSIQHAVGNAYHFQWWLTMLISLGACTWFILMSGLNTTAANIQNWIITAVKFIPLVIAFVIGYILLGTGTVPGPVNPPLPSVDSTTAHPFFSQLNPGLGMFASIPAIFFAFDGFYSTASYQGQMKEPKKISSALGLGLAIVSVVNVGVSLSLMLCSKDGTIAGIEWLQNHRWALIAIYTMITFGVFGIINAYGLYTGIYYGALIKNKGVIGWKAFNKLAKGNEKLAGVLYSLIISLAVIVIFTLIGQFGYLNTGHYGLVLNNAKTEYITDPTTAYLLDTAKLISFADLTANWTSLFAFIFIIFAIVGCLKNRKNNKVKVEKSKLFVPCAWISIIILSLAMLYVVVASFADVGLTISYYVSAVAKYKDTALTNMIGKIVTLVLLFLFVGIMAIEPIHSHRIDKKLMINKNKNVVQKQK